MTINNKKMVAGVLSIFMLCAGGCGEKATDEVTETVEETTIETTTEAGMTEREGETMSSDEQVNKVKASLDSFNEEEEYKTVYLELCAMVEVINQTIPEILEKFENTDRMQGTLVDDWVAEITQPLYNFSSVYIAGQAYQGVLGDMETVVKGARASFTDEELLVLQRKGEMLAEYNQHLDALQEVYTGFKDFANDLMSKGIADEEDKAKFTELKEQFTEVIEGFNSYYEDIKTRKGEELADNSVETETVEEESVSDSLEG